VPNAAKSTTSKRERAISARLVKRKRERSRMNECIHCEGVADFQWLDGGWYVCTGCIKEGLTDTQAEEGESK
jgi:hypothetical protein